MKTSHSFRLANAAKVTIGTGLDSDIWVRFEENGHGFSVMMSRQQANKLKDELAAFNLA